MDKNIAKPVSSADAPETSPLQQQALTLFGCKDGTVVTNPKECFDANKLPPLSIESDNRTA